VHLDALRWRDVEWRFVPSELEEWREWAAAIARQILRDEEAPEILNPGCSWCPIKLDCRSYRRLPGEGVGLLERSTAASIEELWRWREEAAETVKKLKAGIEQVDGMIAERVALDGELVLDGWRWFEDDAWGNVLDKEQLRQVIGTREFVELASISKSALDRYVKRLDDEARIRAIRGCWSREVVGTKLKKEKVKGGDDAAAAVQQ